MSRIIFAWELGENLGHLTRDLPVADGLRALGHEVVFAVRDTTSAKVLPGCERFNFEQAPYASRRRSTVPPASYAEILLVHGYAAPEALSRLTAGWERLFDTCQETLVVANHAPTAVLAARCGGLKCIATCIGFELPPVSDDPRPFRQLDSNGRRRLVASEALVLQNINHVLSEHGAPPIQAVSELFAEAQVLMTTFPELDHYGERQGLTYIGPTGSLKAPTFEWPSSPRKKIFCYLRSTVPDVELTLEALAQMKLNSVCVLPDANEQFLERFSRTTVHITREPVDIANAVESSDLVVTYGTGTMHDALSRGRPLLVCPQNVEQLLAGSRVAALGAGLVLPGGTPVNAIAQVIQILLSEAKYRIAAKRFSERYSGVTAASAVQAVVDLVERVIGKRQFG